MSERAAAFEARFSAAAGETEARLAAILADGSHFVEGTPQTLLAAMRHGALGGGKRLRPFLVAESASLFGAVGDGPAQIGAALELLHCYSLVHDDLPAMDDDDMRRGRPTVHRAYDEATAILAGDALLTLAFALVADAPGVPPESRVALVAALASEAGAAGMVGGQALDLAAEARSLDEDEIARMQAMKTGALLTFACEAGAILAGASSADRARLRHFGQAIGLAFQLADDLLDETADAATLGKAAGKDRGRGKKTLPALHGVDWTRARLAALVAEAEALLSPFGERGDTLAAAARFIANRDR
ncbi:polyprenyl synthetase family protein [Aureimonas mangrovi]|uniref:polyprenyl synthetase family protein n=1 Tax=Aureimonas mangrovi TaxID=2758041 RepID=UPI00163D5B39|nr:farnesyl diphosphate synthase [Aureimonas mangrovi]